MILPESNFLLENPHDNNRVAGSAYRTVLDRVGQFLDGRGIIPETSRSSLCHLMQRTVVSDWCSDLRHGYLLSPSLGITVTGLRMLQRIAKPNIGDPSIIS